MDFSWFSHDFGWLKPTDYRTPLKHGDPLFRNLMFHQSVGGSSRQSCQASPSCTRWFPKIFKKKKITPIPGKKEHKWRLFFSNGLVQPPTSICRSYVGQRRIQFSGFETSFEDLRNAPASSLPIHQQWNNLFMSNGPFRSFLLDLQIPLILAVNPRVYTTHTID